MGTWPADVRQLFDYPFMVNAIFRPARSWPSTAAVIGWFMVLRRQDLRRAQP